MKPARLICFAIFFALPVAARLYAQGLDDAAIELAAKETLLSIPEPPLGYAATKHPLIGGEKLLGFQVQVMREDAIGKVLIKVETRDLSDRDFRLAACKGYINGFATELKGAGFNITAHKVPDITKSDFKTPIVVELTFKNDEGTELLVNKRLFFTTKGYDVTVIATDENELKMLTDWATQIRPASPQ